MAEYYFPLKICHITLAFISLTYFIVRAFWAISGSARLGATWVRVSPHVIDTLLLLSAIGLVIIGKQYPFQAPWLTAKVLALCLYVIFGTLVIKRARTTAMKTVFFILAVATFGYMVSVAFSKNPFPF